MSLRRTLHAGRVVKRSLLLMLSAGYYALRCVTGFAGRLLGRRVVSPRVTLTYHSVQDEQAGRFEAQMRAMVALATPVFADDPSQPDSRTVAVTFDDALQCVFDHAIPVTTRLGVPVTVFVPTGFLGGVPGWIPPARRRPGASGWVASVATLSEADWSLVRLGSHTVTHPHLDTVPVDAMRQELTGSKETLDAISPLPVTMLACPFGSFDDRVLAEARSLGYALVFSNVPETTSPSCGAQLVGRTDVSPDDWTLEFRLKVLGAYDWLARAIPVKRAVVAWLGWAVR